jgi:hypothetical protein
MPAAAGTSERSRVWIAPTALCSVTRVTRLAEGDAAAERPVAQQAGHHEGQGAETGPPGCRAITGAGTRLVRAAHRGSLAIHAAGDDATTATAVHAMIKETLYAAQTGRVVQDGLGRA